jgi:DNA mismatch endonuclease (patch repair protein)
MADTFSKVERSRIMALVKSKDTTPEMLVRRLVHRLGYRYRLHVKSLPGTPDLVFTRLRKIVDVRGCFWHRHGCERCRMPSSHQNYWESKLSRNQARDRKTKRALQRLGWRVLVVWECQTSDAHTMTERLLRFLSRE